MVSCHNRSFIEREGKNLTNRTEYSVANTDYEKFSLQIVRFHFIIPLLINVGSLLLFRHDGKQLKALGQ